MGTVTALPTKTNSLAVDYARKLLERCEAGEVVGFTGCLELRGNLYEIFTSGSADRHATAGQLLHCAMNAIRHGTDG